MVYKSIAVTLLRLQDGWFAILQKYYLQLSPDTFLSSSCICSEHLPSNLPAILSHSCKSIPLLYVA